MPKSLVTITLIGAGSRVFGLNMGGDICQTPVLKGAHVRLVDMDGKKLEEMKTLFQQMSDDKGMDLRLTTYTDRKKALPGSDYVIIAVAVDRLNGWETDIFISRRYGIIEAQGECGGPGGLSLTLRNIPMVLNIAKDIETLCPHALVLNFSNPMTRICHAINKYTRLKVVGLCHGLHCAENLFTRLAGESVTVEGAGINHFNWVHIARFTKSGKDAWPLVKKALHQAKPDVISHWLYGRELLDVFGLFVTPDDKHITDFLHHWRGNAKGFNPRYDLKVKSMPEYWADARKNELRIAEYLHGKKRPMADVKGLSGEGAIPIIATTAGLSKSYTEIAVNIPNDHSIENLPQGMIVEVPGLISRKKVLGKRMGKLPVAVESLVRRQLDIAGLAVEAAVEKNYKKALQALAIDPIVTDLSFAKKYLDDVLKTYRKTIGVFK